MKDVTRKYLHLHIGALIMLILAWATPTAAVQVGEQAPDFSLPSTIGKAISLKSFRGKQMVLIEFYHADFGPT